MQNWSLSTRRLSSAPPPDTISISINKNHFIAVSLPQLTELSISSDNKGPKGCARQDTSNCFLFFAYFKVIYNFSLEFLEGILLTPLLPARSWLSLHPYRKPPPLRLNWTFPEGSGDKPAPPNATILMSS